MKIPLVIRDAEPGDGLSIACIQVTTWRQAYASIVDSGFLDALSIEDSALIHEKRITQSELGRIVAVHKMVPIGFAVFGRKSDPPFEGDWFLHALYVLPDYQGKGCGTQLLDMVKKRGREAGATRLVFGVLNANEPSRKFYQRQGAVFLEQHEYPIGGVNYPTDYFELPVANA